MSICILFNACNTVNYRKKYAEKIIKEVTNYKSQNGYFPKNLKEIGLEESENSPAYYQLTSDTSFVVWYGLEVGNSMVYHSESKAWVEKD